MATMTTKEITAALLLLTALSNSSTKTMQPSSLSVPSSQQTIGKFLTTPQRIYFAYPSINNYTNQPNEYEKAFKAKLLLHLCDLELNGKSPAQLEKFKKAQLNSMRKQQQKILFSSFIAHKYYPQVKSIEGIKKS